MTTTTTTQDRPAEGRAVTRQGRSPAPTRRRVLHLLIDQDTFDLLHICAVRSRMKYTAYVQRFLREAFPFERPEAPAEATDTARAAPRP